jgi:hypothetical protein
MATLFQKLGYNYTDPHGDITNYSANTIEHMEAMPSLIDSWQTQDISDSSVSGYLQNPLSTVSTTISVTANTIYYTINAISSYTVSNVSAVMANVKNVTSSLYTAINNFKSHTDRVSGAINLRDAFAANTSDVALSVTKPFRDTIKGTSKLLTYIIYQTDGISNTSIINGSQTSLFTGPEMNVYSNTIQSYSNTIIASIDVLPNGNSNLTLSQANILYSGISDMITFIDTRRTHDEAFYTNMNTMLSDYEKTRQFSNMGSAETEMLNKYTGTSKLLTRINS